MSTENVMFICTGGDAYLERRIFDCPTEGRRRPVVTRTQLWYGTDWHCLGCGDQWADGERYPRPFARGWRDRSKARARRKWAEAHKYNRAEFMAWHSAQMDLYR